MAGTLASQQTKDEEATWAKLKEGKPTPKQYPTRRRNEMQRMKAQELIHATRVKQTPERATESDKPVGNGKCMRARKAMDSYGNGAYTQGSSTTYPYPVNTREVGHGSELRKGVV